MSQIFNIQDDKVVIKKLALETLEGNLTVTGTLTVDNLIVNNAPDTPAQTDADFGNWVVSDEADLLGKGLNWTWGHGNVQLAYRSGNRLWANSDIDLESDKSYKIDNAPVLSRDTLGSQVTKSNLKQVGTLKTLAVSGDTALADFAFFNSTFGRLGINTQSPNGTLSIADNNVEIVAGADRDGIGYFGTYTSHDIALVSDNTARITLKNNGQVIFGNESTNNADVRIYGTLHVETIVSDNRIDRYQPLEFKTSRDRGIYGQGLVWTGTGGMRQLIMRAEPDRLWTTESFDLAADRSYHVDGVPVLSQIALGSSVIKSNLSKLGTLEDLTVDGEATFMTRINASRAVINAKTILFNDAEEFTITNSQLSAQSKLSFKVAGDETYYADSQEIAIGNKQNTRRPVKVFGPLTVGVNNPEEGVDLSVKGNIKFANKKFATGTDKPTAGDFNKGDIVWNSNPTQDNFIGWVCVESGAPGAWLPFGAIARQ
jgi:hypothetical protein